MAEFREYDNEHLGISWLSELLFLKNGSSPWSKLNVTQNYKADEI